MAKENKKISKTSVDADLKQVAYIGDDIGYEVRRDTVFIGGIPKILKEYIEKIPEIKHLLVDIDELVESKLKLEDPTSIESISNRAVQEKLRK